MNRFDTPLDHGPVRLRVGAAAGVVGIVAMAVRILMATHFSLDHVKGSIAWSADHPGAAFVANLAQTLAFGGIAFCCITLTGMVRGRGKWLVQIGGWGVALTWIFDTTNTLGQIIASLGSYPDHRAAADVIDHFMHSPQAALLIAVLVSTTLWPILFCLGLCRSGLVGWWYAGLLVVWVALEVAVSNPGWLGVLLNGVPTAAIVAVWVKLLLDRANAVAEPSPTVATTPAAV